jgi:hypothetical protein
MDGTKKLGDPVRVRGGHAFLITRTLTVGTHSLTAVFPPTNPRVLQPSTSRAVRVVVTRRIRDLDQQTITARAEQLIQSELNGLL